MVRVRSLHVREAVRRTPATSIFLFREMNVEDACEIKLLGKFLTDRTVHGILHAGTLGCTSPLV